MISTVLPNITTYNPAPPNLKDNVVISAYTNQKYFYPEHKTPYVFVTNFLNKGTYRINKRFIDISDKFFYFLNNNNDLEILFSKPVPLQTLFIFFQNEFVHNCFSYARTSDEELLSAPDKYVSDGFEVPTIPFELTATICEKLSQVSQKSLHKEELDNFLFELIAEVLQLNSKTAKQINKIDAVKRSTKEELYRRLLLARELMHDNVCESLTIDEIAQEACLNKFHFLSTFKSLFNITPHQYYTEIKLQKACHLLEQHSVGEVCSLLGFESVGSFSNLFKKRFKISPSAISLQP